MVFKWFSLIWRFSGPTGEKVSQCWETQCTCTGRHLCVQDFIRTNLRSFYEYLRLNTQRKTVEMQALTIGLHTLISKGLDCPLVIRFLTFIVAFQRAASCLEMTTSLIWADYLKALSHHQAMLSSGRCPSGGFLGRLYNQASLNNIVDKWITPAGPLLQQQYGLNWSASGLQI